MVLAICAAFVVIVVVIKKVGNLLTTLVMSDLGRLTFVSGVVWMCRLVIGLLLIVLCVTILTLVFTTCSVCSRFACSGPMLICLTIRLEFGMMSVVIRKNVVEEKLVGIVILVVVS